MNYKIMSIYYINIMKNSGDVESCLNSIRELLKSKYEYEETDFFINLTGPTRNKVLKDNDDKSSFIIKDDKTILNILSQEEEKNLESDDFKNCVKIVTTILPETEEIWSVGGSTSQRMFSKTGNGPSKIPIGAVKINNSTDEQVEDHAKTILSSDNVVLYNSIGYQYDYVKVNGNGNPDLSDKDKNLLDEEDIKLITGGTFVSTGENDCCELLKKISKNGEVFLSVFVPTTPNPTSGFLLFLPEKDVKILDMSVEDAAKLIISAGLFNPD